MYVMVITNTKRLLICSLKLSGLWAKVRQALDYDIVSDSVICGTCDGSIQSNNIFITLVNFVICNDWLLHSLDSKKRPTLFIMELFKSELQLRMKIYEKCNMIVHVNQIINLCHCCNYLDCVYHFYIVCDLTLTLPGPSAGVSGSLDSYCTA